MPYTSHVGVSQRIEEDGERERLREIVTRLRAERGLGHGFIVRTVADRAGEGELAADLAYLERLWERVEPSMAAGAVPSLVYEDLPTEVRVLRDLVTVDVATIRIDCPTTHGAVLRFVDRFLPELRERVLLHDEPTPLFERHGVEAEVARALSARVPLKCGGHLVIEQTEAMTTIDVNTGGFVGGSDLEDTVYRTNLEAAAAIPRHLRLRNLGGIVVVDFIDMDDGEHRRQVLRTLEKAADADPARIRIGGISELGLVELSRKRTRESLVQQLCEPCSACGGRGWSRTAESVCFDVLRALQRDAARRAGAPGGGAPRGAWLVRAAQPVLDRLLDDNAGDVEALAERIGAPIRFQLEPCYGIDQFDVVLLQDAD
jgi:ribonuclease G